MPCKLFAPIKNLSIWYGIDMVVFPPQLPKSQLRWVHNEFYENIFVVEFFNKMFLEHVLSLSPLNIF
jgi:hypothetical protein